MTASPIEKKELIFYDKSYVLFFVIISAAFSFVESVIPKPLIFIKIGFAYIPILLIIDKTDFLSLSMIIFFKSLIASIFAGTLFSFTAILSFSGSIGCIIGLLLIYPFIKNLSKVSISILLSIFTNLFQIIYYSFFIIKDINLLKLVPLLNLISIASGLITSIIAIQIESKYISIKFILKEKV